MLTAASGLAAWLEYRLLRVHVERHVGTLPSMGRLSMTLWGCAALAAAAGYGVAAFIPTWHPIVDAMLILGVYGAGYLVLTRVAGVDGARRA